MEREFRVKLVFSDDMTVRDAELCLVEKLEELVNAQSGVTRWETTRIRPVKEEVGQAPVKKSVSESTKKRKQQYVAKVFCRGTAQEKLVYRWFESDEEAVLGFPERIAKECEGDCVDVYLIYLVRGAGVKLIQVFVHPEHR